jgi:hypothetical protein
MKPLFLTLLSLLLLAAGLAYAAETYSYKCPSCGLIQTFDRPQPGTKCPRDGWIMVSQ